MCVAKKNWTASCVRNQIRESTLICETTKASNKLVISLPILRKSHHLAAGRTAEAVDFAQKFLCPIKTGSTAYGGWEVCGGWVQASEAAREKLMLRNETLKSISGGFSFCEMRLM